MWYGLIYINEWAVIKPANNIALAAVAVVFVECKNVHYIEPALKSMNLKLI